MGPGLAVVELPALETLSPLPDTYIDGCVVRYGRPMSGVQVTALAHVATTGANGCYRLAGQAGDGFTRVELGNPVIDATLIATEPGQLIRHVDFEVGRALAADHQITPTPNRLVPIDVRTTRVSSRVACDRTAMATGALDVIRCAGRDVVPTTQIVDRDDHEVDVPIVTRRTGLALEVSLVVDDDGPWLVSVGDAARAVGFRPGDIILSIDGISTAGLSLAEVEELGFVIPPGRPFAWMIDRGGEIQMIRALQSR